jgi:hypothetical protein
MTAATSKRREETATVTLRVNWSRKPSPVARFYTPHHPLHFRALHGAQCISSFTSQQMPVRTLKYTSTCYFLALTRTLQSVKLITPWNKVHLEKQIIAQLVKTNIILRNPRFVTVFRRPRYRSLHILYPIPLRSILILSSRIRLTFSIIS